MAVEAIFKDGSTKAYTRSLNQYDKGQILKFVGVHLPETFEVHFSNQKDGGVANIVIGTDDFAAIPDAYLATGEYVYAWLYDQHDVEYAKIDYSVEDEILTEEHEDPVTYTKGTTLYQVTIPVIKRPMQIVMPMPGIGEPHKEYSIDGESLVITTN